MQRNEYPWFTPVETSGWEGMLNRISQLFELLRNLQTIMLTCCYVTTVYVSRFLDIFYMSHHMPDCVFLIRTGIFVREKKLPRFFHHNCCCLFHKYGSIILEYFTKIAFIAIALSHIREIFRFKTIAIQSFALTKCSCEKIVRTILYINHHLSSL